VVAISCFVAVVHGIAANISAEVDADANSIGIAGVANCLSVAVVATGALRLGRIGASPLDTAACDVALRECKTRLAQARVDSDAHSRVATVVDCLVVLVVTFGPLRLLRVQTLPLAALAVTVALAFRTTLDAIARIFTNADAVDACVGGGFVAAVVARDAVVLSRPDKALPVLAKLGLVAVVRIGALDVVTSVSLCGCGNGCGCGRCCVGGGSELTFADNVVAVLDAHVVFGPAVFVITRRPNFKRRTSVAFPSSADTVFVTGVSGTAVLARAWISADACAR
jgi:hypothetical protein